MYFETGDRICADFRRSGNADHAPVIEYSMGIAIITALLLIGYCLFCK